ncbi:MAG: hypothetical protein JWM55_1295 [Acidimicrobiaceae bacterium]|nr:hypothetical protein [Acidimicrobiaceae bacterium]
MWSQWDVGARSSPRRCVGHSRREITTPRKYPRWRSTASTPRDLLAGIWQPRAFTITRQRPCRPVEHERPIFLNDVPSNGGARGHMLGWSLQFGRGVLAATECPPVSRRPEGLHVLPYRRRAFFITTNVTSLKVPNDRTIRLHRRTLNEVLSRSLSGAGTLGPHCIARGGSDVERVFGNEAADS